MTVARYGHITSNVCQGINASLLKESMYPVTQLLKRNQEENGRMVCCKAFRSSLFLLDEIQGTILPHENNRAPGRPSNNARRRRFFRGSSWGHRRRRPGKLPRTDDELMVKDHQMEVVERVNPVEGK
ncbi:hypothetical protein GEMRC1_013466 [Eukaryota sp. GEM-RC1]